MVLGDLQALFNYCTAIGIHVAAVVYVFCDRSVFTNTPYCSPNSSMISNLIFLLQVIIVLDCSGSMSGRSIAAAERLAKYFLHSLPTSVFFNVVRFGSTHEKFFSKSELLNDKNLSAAAKRLTKLKADMGGTNMLTPLQDILVTPVRKGCARQVFVVTDGHVHNTDEVVCVQ